jgi:hypothetical protein
VSRQHGFLSFSSLLFSSSFPLPPDALFHGDLGFGTWDLKFLHEVLEAGGFEKYSPVYEKRPRRDWVVFVVTLRLKMEGVKKNKR